MVKTITIPHNFKPRPYQRGLYNCLNDGCKRAIVVMHRRAGKDKVCINIMAREAFKRRGSYFYILPYFTQARRIVWEGLDKDGFRNIDHFPRELIARRDNQQMTLELVNGSFVRFLGSDNIDSIVGTNPVGVIFSEFSLHKVEAWNYLRPILIENDGWALFNGTPRGKNHMYRLWQAAQHDPKWYTDMETIEDTGVMTAEQVEDEIRNGMPRALARQEFYCSFDAAMTGAYYGEAMEWADADGRIGQVSWDPNQPVHTAWDLGVDDTLVVICFQQLGNAIHVIDLVHDNGKGLEFYVKQLRERPYAYGYHILPHDVRVRELGSGMSRLQTLYSLGLQNIVIANRVSIEEGIHTARSLLARCHFNQARCERLIEALKQYRASWDAQKEVYGAPIHDWASDFADAFRMLAIALRDNQISSAESRPLQALGSNYDPVKINDREYRRRVYGDNAELSQPLPVVEYSSSAWGAV